MGRQGQPQVFLSEDPRYGYHPQRNPPEGGTGPATVTNKRLQRYRPCTKRADISKRRCYICPTNVTQMSHLCSPPTPVKYLTNVSFVYMCPNFSHQTRGQTTKAMSPPPQQPSPAIRTLIRTLRGARRHLQVKVLHMSHKCDTNVSYQYLICVHMCLTYISPKCLICVHLSPIYMLPMCRFCTCAPTSLAR